MRLLGIGHFTCLGLTPELFVRHAARAGFGSVGLRLWPVAPGGTHYCPASSAEVALLQDRLLGEGIELYDIEVVTVDSAFEPEAFRPVAEVAARLGARRINVCAEDWDRGALVTKFARLCEIAAELELGVDLEWMRWRGVNTLSGARALIEEAGVTNAGLLVDALHLYRCGGTASEVAALPSALVRSAQFCDAPTRPPATRDEFIAEARGGRLLPGEGGLDLAALAAALPSDVALSVEIPNSSDGRPVDERFDAIFKATTEILERGA